MTHHWGIWRSELNLELQQSPRPNRCRLIAHQLPIRELREVCQHIEGFWPQRNDDAVAAQAGRSAVDLERSKTITLAFRHVSEERPFSWGPRTV